MPTLTLAQQKKLYKQAKKAYYNSDPIMSDAKFDKLEDAIKAQDPEWPELHKTGVKILGKKSEVKHLCLMPSLSKAYPEDLPKWLAKQDLSVVVMPKLDGSSLQVVYEGGKLVRVATRGDGIHGKDITFLAPHLNLPKTIGAKGRWVLRCEAVIKQKTFEKKYSADFDNPRNLVNGALNRTHATPVLADTDIVVLAVLEPVRDLARGFRTLDALHGVNPFNVIDWKFVDISVTQDWSKLLKNTRKRCPYEADGLVLVNSNVDVKYKDADKPKWAIAYKENLSEENAPTVKVKQVIWQTSHRGRLIPKVEIEPVRLDGVTVKFATVHNAKWMEDRGIGPGAQIKIVRSGGVIPKIIGVAKKGKMQYPEVDCEWKGVHLVLKEATAKQADIKPMLVRRLHKFLTILGIENVALKTLSTAYDAGLQTPISYLKAKSPEYFQKHDIGVALSQKLYEDIQKLRSNEIQLKQLMLASACFDAGIGDRRLSLFEKHIKLSLLLRMPDRKIIQYLTQIPGIREKTTDVFIKGLHEFREWFEKVEPYFSKVVSEVPRPEKKRTGPLVGQNATWTGYRSSEEESAFTEKGGVVVPFGSSTTILFYKEGGKASSKVDKAQQKGIKVTTFNRFMKGLK